MESHSLKPFPLTQEATSKMAAIDTTILHKHAADLPTVCPRCESPEYEDVNSGTGVSVNRYCKNNHMLGRYERPAESTTESPEQKEPGRGEDIHVGLLPEQKDQAMSTVQDTTTSTNHSVRLLPIECMDRSRTQVRALLNQDTVKEYALAMTALKERKASGETIDARDE